MSRGRAVFSAVLVALGAIAYGASPIDIIPELLVGPLGLADDLAIWVGAGFAIWKLLSGSRPANGGATAPPATEPTAPTTDSEPGGEPRWEQKRPE